MAIQPDPIALRRSDVATSGRASGLLVEQFLGGARDQQRAAALAPFEKQQALAEDEAIEQEGLRVGFVRRKASGAVELADDLQPCGIDA